MSLEEGAGLVCLGSFSLGICQHVERMSYDQLLPSSKGFLAEPGYTAWDRVSKSTQLWSGMEASKLHPPGLPFPPPPHHPAAAAVTPYIYLPCPLFSWFQTQVGKRGDVMTLFVLWAFCFTFWGISLTFSSKFSLVF